MRDKHNEMFLSARDESYRDGVTEKKVRSKIMLSGDDKLKRF